MAKFLSTMLVGFCLSCLFFGTLKGQATVDPSVDPARKDEPPAATRVAVVDLTRVFTTSKLYQRQQELMKTKITESQEASKRMIKEIQQLSQKWKGENQGSEERKELEILVNKKQLELQQFQLAEAQKFNKEHATICLNVYQLAAPEIANYAQAHAIDLVLWKQPEPVRDEDPVKLMQSLSRNVLYENKLDITDEIIIAVAEL